MKEINSEGWLELRDYVCNDLITNEECFSKLKFRGHVVVIESNPTYHHSSFSSNTEFLLWVDIPENSVTVENVTKRFSNKECSYGKSLWKVIEYLDNTLNEFDKSTIIESVSCASDVKLSGTTVENKVSDDTMKLLYYDLLEKAKLLVRNRRELLDVEPNIIFYSYNNVVAEFNKFEMYGDSENVIIDLSPFLYKSISYVKQYVMLKGMD